MINKDDAEQIARKLKAESKSGRRHDLAIVKFQGKHVTQFGIRRGDRDQSHSYIPRQLYISPRQTKTLSECPLSAEEYFNILANKGVIKSD